MPKKKAIDSKKLIKMIKDETPRPEIMQAFGFKTTAQLNTAYVNAMVDEGIVPEIKSGPTSRKQAHHLSTLQKPNNRKHIATKEAKTPIAERRPLALTIFTRKTWCLGPRSRGLLLDLL